MLYPKISLISDRVELPTKIAEMFIKPEDNKYTLFSVFVRVEMQLCFGSLI